MLNLEILIDICGGGEEILRAKFLFLLAQNPLGLIRMRDRATRPVSKELERIWNNVDLEGQ